LSHTLFPSIFIWYIQTKKTSDINSKLYSDFIKPINLQPRLKDSPKQLTHSPVWKTSSNPSTKQLLHFGNIDFSNELNQLTIESPTFYKQRSQTPNFSSRSHSLHAKLMRQHKKPKFAYNSSISPAEKIRAKTANSTRKINLLQNSAKKGPNLEFATPKNERGQRSRKLWKFTNFKTSVLQNSDFASKTILTKRIFPAENAKLQIENRKNSIEQIYKSLKQYNSEIKIKGTAFEYPHTKRYTHKIKKSLDLIRIKAIPMNMSKRTQELLRRRLTLRQYERKVFVPQGLMYQQQKCKIKGNVNKNEENTRNGKVTLKIPTMKSLGKIILFLYNFENIR